MSPLVPQPEMLLLSTENPNLQARSSQRDACDQIPLKGLKDPRNRSASEIVEGLVSFKSKRLTYECVLAQTWVRLVAGDVKEPLY